MVTIGRTREFVNNMFDVSSRAQIDNASVPSSRFASYSRVAGWLTFLPIVALHTLFIFTFPLNNRGGDSGNYFEMLLTGQSSLVHPSGYSFLIGLPFRHGPLASLTVGANPEMDQILLIAQHGTSIVAMVTLFILVRHIYGAMSASIATLIFGMNLLFMGATSSTYPEWLQASLFVLALWTAGCGYYDGGDRRKVCWYALSILLFAWCFLVKFNALVLGALYLVPLASERRPWTAKLLWSGAYVVLFVGTVVTYQLLVHEPSTHTRRLTADTGWVLLSRIQVTYDNKLNVSNGLATKRWLALASALPMRYEFAGPGMFSRVDAVPSEVRAPYRAIFDRIVAADDASLDEWLRSHPVPSGFTVGVSPIPVCYFVGLFEGNDLAVKVAIEAVRASPARFVKSVWSEFIASIIVFPQYPIVPTVSNMPAFDFSVKSQLSNGRVVLNQSPAPGGVPYSYRYPVVWRPGMEWFDRMNRSGAAETLTKLSIGLAILTAIISVVYRRRMTAETTVILGVSAALITFMIASCVTLAFRWKEFCLALPLIGVLAGAGIGWAPVEAIRLVCGIRRA